MAAVEKAGLFADLERRHPQSGSRAVPSGHRQVDGRRGAQHRLRLQQGQAAARSAAEIHAGPGAARVEGPLGRGSGQGGLPSHRLGPASAQGRAGHRAVAGRHEDQRGHLQRQHRHHEGRQRRRGRRRHHLPLLLVPRSGRRPKRAAATRRCTTSRNQDPGAFVSLSGGGVLKSSKKPEQAQQFMQFVTGKAGQEVLEKGTSFEYPVASGVPANPASAAARLAAGTRGRPVDAGRPEGDGSDDEGWFVVGGRSPVSRPRGTGFAVRQRPPVPARWCSATVAILVAATVHSAWVRGVGAVSVGWTRAYDLVVRPRVGELLFNTVALVVVTVPLCVVIGVGVRLAGGADRICPAGRSGVRCSSRRLPFRHSSTATRGSA